MRSILYRYNADTCQYERIRVKPLNVFLYTGSVLLTAVAMLAGMLVVHDYLIDSQKEITLRAENSALKKNRVLLASQLSTIENSLAELQKEDLKLHQKFFGVAPDKTESGTSAMADESLLLGGLSSSQKALKNLDTRSTELLKRSAGTNSFYRERLSDRKNDFSRLASLPTSQPIQPWDAKKITSGIGMRINPFHKGMYEHPGIDIAMSRGTNVLVTADGRVTQLKKSELQAGYGNYVEVDHGNGFVTRYAHLENILVKHGQAVRRGTVIGTVGSSGGSIAPHLHYEVVRDGKNVNPVLYMMQGVSSTEHYSMKTISEKQNQSLD